MASPGELRANLRADLERRLARLSPAAAAGRGAVPWLRPRDPEAPVPLSFAQELLWLMDRATPGLHAYNVTRTARLVGTLDLAALGRALETLVERHEILRTTYEIRGGDACQIVHPPQAVPLALVDVRGALPESREDEAVRCVRELTQRPFDLARDLQLRATLVRLGADDHVLVLESHHIASDAWSRNILLRELDQLYAAYRSGATPQLAPLRLQYADFAVWQRERLRGAYLARLLSYWREELTGAPAALDLPTDYPHPPVATFAGASRSAVFPPALSASLRSLGAALDATPFMTLLAAFHVMLARYSGQRDVLVGSPIAGREADGLDGVIGYCANTLVLRASLADDPPFATLLARVRHTCLGAYEHQDVPFEKLVLDLAPSTVPGRAPLVQAMFTLQDAALAQTRLAGTRVLPFGADRGASKFDIALFVQERSDGLRAELQYRTELFDAATIDRMLANFGVLLDGIVADPNRPVSRLPLLSERERCELMHQSRASDAGAASAAPVVALIAAQTARTPAATALDIAGTTGVVQTLTYAELDERAEHVAAFLRSHGIRPGVGVGVCVPRSRELLVGLLGVLKAGGFYVPLDPAYPAARLHYMLRDSGVPVVLTAHGSRDALALPPGSHAPLVVSLDADWDSAVLSAPPAAPAGEAAAGDAAYTIYTSGSTGQPKGVLVEHRALANFLGWMQTEYPLAPGAALLQIAPSSFDISVWEFFSPLIAGARVVMAPPKAHFDPSDVLATIERHGVTTVQLVPSQLQMIVDSTGNQWSRRLGALQRLFLIGETLPSALLDRVLAACPTLEIINCYGPTEATIYATHWRVGAASRRTGGSVSLGKPLANVAVYVLDGALQPVPFGVAGELCIGGAGLARGYLNRPDLTAERFVPSPFGPPRARLYRTGDRACRRSDGVLEYLGRGDGQVKLRGYRIELGEIEAALAAQPEVGSAAVLLRADGRDPRLVAYCLCMWSLAEADESALATELRRRLKGVLPEYMVPAAIVWLETWPLGPSGKLDRTALQRLAPAPAPPAAGPAAFLEPATPTECAVARIWAEVLRRERMSVDAEFFDVGGQSLSAMRIVSRLREQFDVQVPLGVVFERPTIAGLSAYVDEQRATGAPLEPSLVRVPRAVYRRPARDVGRAAP